MCLRENLAANLKSLRALKNASLEEFAYEIGVSRTTLFCMERQSSNSTIDTIEQICGRLGISPLALLSDNCDPIDLLVTKYVIDHTRWLCCMTEQDKRKTAILIDQLSSIAREPLLLYLANKR